MIDDFLSIPSPVLYPKGALFGLLGTSPIVQSHASLYCGIEQPRMQVRCDLMVIGSFEE
jgi:hypothetical protein